MEFLQSRFSQGAAGYDQRIRNLFPFYEAIHGAINAALRVLLPAQAELLIVGVNRPAVESAMNERMKAIYFVPAEKIESLLRGSGYHQAQQFFKVLALGGWVARNYPATCCGVSKNHRD